jgi:hypothetical protein
MSRSGTERKLRDVHDRLTRARKELGVLDEQLAALAGDADDARMRALVAESPGARLEHRDAQRHADAMAKSRAKVLASIADLEKTQDELLDKLVVEPS